MYTKKVRPTITFWTSYIDSKSCFAIDRHVEYNDGSMINCGFHFLIQLKNFALHFTFCWYEFKCVDI
jgi:hypothetical protein